MNDYGLDLHGEMLLEEYCDKQPLFEKLQSVVMDQLGALVKQSGI